MAVLGRRAVFAREVLHEKAVVAQGSFVRYKDGVALGRRPNALVKIVAKEGGGVQALQHKNFIKCVVPLHPIFHIKEKAHQFLASNLARQEVVVTNKIFEVKERI